MSFDLINTKQRWPDKPDYNKKCIALLKLMYVDVVVLWLNFRHTQEKCQIPCAVGGINDVKPNLDYSRLF